MSHSSILGGESAAKRAAGRDADLLGPSDTSDSGSDVQGEHTMSTDADNAGELGSMTVDLDSDSDAFGTGERGSAAGDGGRDGGDILPDHIIDSPDADLVSDDVTGDKLTDAGFTDDVEALGDDEDDEEEAASASDDGVAGQAHAAGSGRVHTLPPGTLEAVEEK